jgi:hypothetical protein
MHSPKDQYIIQYILKHERRQLVEEDIQEGEFAAEEYPILEEKLDGEAEAVCQVYADGSISLARQNGLVELNREQAYNLLDVLYRHHMEMLRGRQDTVPLSEPLAEQWQATGTCQINPEHTGRDLFRCDGCARMCCNECGEQVEDEWVCEWCLGPVGMSC